MTKPMEEFVIVPFHRASHRREQFSCGKSALDEFLQSLVTQYEKRGLGRTFVAMRAGDPRVLGYYTLASGAVAADEFPAKAARRLPRHPVPVVRLARLAVDKAMHGKGLGRMLMVDMALRVLQLAKNLGIHAVVVDALDDEARRFYKTFGFSPFPVNDRHLFVTMETIRELCR